MKEIEKLFDIKKLQEGFFKDIESAVNEFCKTENNKDVYALVLYCDESIGQMWLGYSNLELYNKMLRDYSNMAKSRKKPNLSGIKYSEGEFRDIDFEKNKYLERFCDIYYYMMTEEYYGEDELPEIECTEEARAEYRRFFEELIIDCIERMKKHLGNLNKTEDFIIYFTYHDISDERHAELISKTVDKDLFEKLR